MLKASWARRDSLAPLSQKTQQDYSQHSVALRLLVLADVFFSQEKHALSSPFSVGAFRLPSPLLDAPRFCSTRPSMPTRVPPPPSSPLHADAFPSFPRSYILSVKHRSECKHYGIVINEEGRYVLTNKMGGDIRHPSLRNLIKYHLRVPPVVRWLGRVSFNSRCPSSASPAGRPQNNPSFRPHPQPTRLF